MTPPHRQRQNQRFFRQVDHIERRLPVARHRLELLTARRFALLRVPLALVLVLGGMVGFLPVLGFWMLPLGLMLLALDLPVLRAPMGALVVRGRAVLRRRRQSRRSP